MNQIQKEIFNIIRGNIGPALSLKQLSQLTPYSYPTVGKYVLVLEVTKKINVDRTRPPYVLVKRLE